MASTAEEDNARQVELWKMKKMIRNLENARGNGTSMISLIIPPGDQINKVATMLQGEYGTASNIKSRVNRLSVLSAITSTQQKLKLYNKVPPNGLVIYVGTVLTDENKEKKLAIDFEPFRPINTSLYLCDNRFHTEALKELLEDDAKWGFIVVDGNGALYATLTGNTRNILYKFSVELPKKHGRGGQSALRFARLRLEKRHNYLRKVAEFATQCFITNDLPNVKGIILAGSAEFKNDLHRSDLFDPRLKEVVVGTVDVSYGGENGLNQAIELSKETLQDTKYVEETRLISKFFEEIAKDTGKYCFGVSDTMKALENGAVEILMVWENLETMRYELRNTSPGGGGAITVLHLNPGQENDPKLFQDPETGVDLEVVDKTSLVEWFAENYQKFGTTLEFVTDSTQEGSQFCKGFGGIGGLLRWQFDFQAAQVEVDFEDDEWATDDDEW